MNADGGAPRVILHVDMDAFFANVELRRRPELRGRPVAVGGTGRRGVIAAASYEARRFGVFSAMPTVTAVRKCPQLVVLPGDHELYATVSGQVGEILRSFTPLVEPLALDEAFLDVTGAQRLHGDGVTIARSIRAAISDRLQLSCGVGVAPSKFLAKMASKAAKPRATLAGVVDGPGVFEVRAGEEVAFLHPQSIRALWGVGPATAERLARLGVSTIGDLATIDRLTLVSALGEAVGGHLHDLSWGRDPRPVVVERTAQSIGHEETYATDRRSMAEVRVELGRLADAVARRLRAAGLAARTATLKVRFADFTTVTRSVTVSTPIHSAHALRRAVQPLAESLDPSGGIRLLGISVAHFTAPAAQLQLDLGGAGSGEPAEHTAPDHEWDAAEVTVDSIRQRFGDLAIGTASSLTGPGRRASNPGSQQWGPNDPAAEARPSVGGALPDRSKPWQTS